MRERFFQWLASVIEARRGALLVGLILTTGFAVVWIGTGHLQVSSSRNAVVNDDDPEQLRLMEYNARFGNINDLVVLLESEDKAALRAAADRAAAALRKLDMVADVFYRVELEALADKGLYYLPTDRLERVRYNVALMRDTLAKRDSVPDTMTVPGIIGAIGKLNESIDEFTDPEDDADPTAGLGKITFSDRDLEQGVEFAVATIDELRHWVEDPTRRSISLKTDFKTRETGLSLDDGGYLVARDGSLLLMRVQGTGDLVDEKFASPFVKGVEAVLSETVGGVSFGVTGVPAFVSEEQHALKRDMPLTSAISAIGALMLFLIAYRSARGVIVTMLPLAVAMAWALCMVALTIGGLSMLTSPFAVIIIGMGIDFSVHLFTRIREERWAGASPQEAVRTSLNGTGPAIVTGAITSAAAFGAMAVGSFRGTRELGLMASMGLIMALVATLLILPMALGRPGTTLLSPERYSPEVMKRIGLRVVIWPVLLAAAGLWWWLGDVGLMMGGGLILATAVAFWVAPAILERVQTRRDGGWEPPRRLAWAAVIACLGITVWLGLSIRAIDFNFDVNTFIPPDAKPLKALKKLEAAGVGGIEFAVTQAPDLAHAKAQYDALGALADDGTLVERVESIFDVLPPDLTAKEPIVSAIRKASTGLPHLAFEPHPTDDPKALVGHLKELRWNLQNALPATLGELGQQKVLPHLKTIDAAVERLMIAVKAIEPTELRTRLDRFERHVAKLTPRIDGFFHSEDRPLAPTDLPESMISPFYHLAADGAETYATRVYPSGNISKPEFTESFKKALREIDSEATGYAIVYLHFGVLMREGFREAAFWASLVVLLLVFLDLRRPIYVALALFPLVMGTVWMVGLMNVLGIDYNYANVISIPLIIGIGIDSSIHLIHRWRETDHDTWHAVRTTGKAIIVSSVTTMMAFGSLALASHIGAQSLGKTLVLGVSSCLVTSLVFLPAVLMLLPTPRRRA